MFFFFCAGITQSICYQYVFNNLCLGKELQKLYWYQLIEEPEQ